MACSFSLVLTSSIWVLTHQHKRAIKQDISNDLELSDQCLLNHNPCNSLSLLLVSLIFSSRQTGHHNARLQATVNAGGFKGYGNTDWRSVPRFHRARLRHTAFTLFFHEQIHLLPGFTVACYAPWQTLLKCSFRLIISMEDNPRKAVPPHPAAGGG